NVARQLADVVGQPVQKLFLLTREAIVTTPAVARPVHQPLPVAVVLALKVDRDDVAAAAPLVSLAPSLGSPAGRRLDDRHAGQVGELFLASLLVNDRSKVGERVDAGLADLLRQPLHDFGPELAWF